MKTNRSAFGRSSLAVAFAAASLGIATPVTGFAQAAGEAVFEGRPAASGAQAGTGAMAGPPQGGLGPQSRGSGGLFPQRDPADREAPRDEGARPRDEDPGVAPPRNDRGGSTVAPQRSTRETTGRAARNTRDAARHGVLPFGSD